MSTSTSTSAVADGSTRSREQSDVRILVSFHQLACDLPLEVHAEFVEVCDGEEIRNLSSDGCETHALAELQVRAVAYRHEPEGATCDWQTEYRNCRSVDLRRATEMNATLKKVCGALARRERELGPPQTFTEYLARVAIALRVSRFGFLVGARSDLHRTNEYQWTDAVGMAHRISDHIAHWRSNHGPTGQTE
jgi:hypothetical protein